MPSQPVSPKKQRLTLAQLAAYDDILTDALVDHVSPLLRPGLHVTNSYRCTFGPLFAKTRTLTTHPVVSQKRQSLQFSRSELL